MNTKGRFPLLFALMALMALNQCAPRFRAIKPEGFAAYPEGSTFRAVSHDKIVYRVCTLENEPYAKFPFWKEALIKRMTTAGYRIVADSTLALSNKEALLLEMAAPIQESDYSYLVAMAVNGKEILIVEAAGKVESFQKKKDAIIKAISAIVIK
jgi:hypothetical protein